MAQGRGRSKGSKGGAGHAKATPAAQHGHNSPANQPNTAGTVALHRGRFLHWSPQAIVAACASPDGATVAVAREHGDVELWSTDTCIKTKTLAGMDGAATTSVLLTRQPGQPARVFTAGLPGLLQERDLHSGAVLASCDSFGGAVWAMASQQSSGDDDHVRVAVACDDGVVRIFVIQAGMSGMQYIRSLPRVQGRALSCAWHPTARDVLVVGSGDGCIRAWNVAQGSELVRITAARTTAEASELCVWSVLVLPDGTIVSGDSSGRVAFWDGTHGTQLASFQRHVADVLTLAAMPDGSRVFAAGVDPQLTLFHRIAGRPGGQGDDAGCWTYIDSKRPHTHDVRTLVLVQRRAAQPLLLSGGNDAQLIAYVAPLFLKQHPVRLEKLPDPPLLSVAPSLQGSTMIASAQGLYVDVWQWDTHDDQTTTALAQQPPPADGTPLPCTATPQHVLRLKKLGNQHILAVALSPDGKYLAYSDAHKLRAYQLHTNTAPHPPTPPRGTPPHPPTRLSLNTESLGTLCALCFTGDGKHLLTADVQGTVSLLSLPQGGALGGALVCQWDQLRLAAARGPGAPTGFDMRAAATAALGGAGGGGDPLGPRPVSLLAASADGRYAAAAGPTLAYVFDLTRHTCLGHLPPLDDSSLHLTALALSNDGRLVAVASADSRVMVCHVPSLQVHRWTRGVEEQRQRGGGLAHVLGHARGMVFGPHEATPSLFLYSPSSICYLDLTHEDTGPTNDTKRAPRKRRRQDAHTPAVQHTPGSSIAVRVVQCMHPVVYCGQMGPSSALLLEGPWEEVLKALPTPPVFRKRFGV